VTARLLQVEDLSVSFRYRDRLVTPLDGITLNVSAGESVGIVGESGSGKSTLALALLRLTPAARDLKVSGKITFEGRDVFAMSKRELSTYRGGGVALIPQDPMTSLNPTLSVGRQVGETIALRESTRKPEAETLKALEAVRVPEPEKRLCAYPHQLSGGLRQRVVGAIGIARNPRLLIADEPTTALDVTVQRRYLDMLDGLRRERGMAMLLISHDLGVVAKVCERIIVMYAGQIVEDAPARDILDHPRHWYAAALVAAARGVSQAQNRLPAIGGSPPALTGRPPGCRFAPRCTNVQPQCETPPGLVLVSGNTRRLRCHFPRDAG
jgi:oligopeptide/dipeptide ABC transporter ATP-binding protein